MIETEEEIITEKEFETELDALINPTQNIVLYNDDHNTFQHVIECLRKYCKHTLEQAEQCTVIIHHNGKCGVKNGSYKELKPICETLLEKGLTAKIE
jgi:ATP-dependent Clp protease adaptor protein ClpS